MRVFVTGDKGFVGSWLCDRLRTESHEVVTLPPSAYDIRQPESLWEIKDIDRIYHLASKPSPKWHTEEPIRTIMTSVVGTYNILELAKRTSARVFLASTVDVENYYAPSHPRASYVEGKKSAEVLCLAYRNEYGVDVKVARLFSSYGPGMKLDDGRVIPVFILKALRNEPIEIVGDGEQIDSFCYITDMVDGIVNFMESGDWLPGPIEIGNPFLNGNATGLITIGDLAEKIVSICGSSSDIICKPSESVNKNRIPNIYAAKKYLDWIPRVGLKNGLTVTVEYFRGLVEKGQ